MIIQLTNLPTVKKSALAEETYVQIKAVAFSIGSDSGTFPVWAYGLGRWFEIKPQPEYESTYRHMGEAVMFYYGLTDLYDDNPKATVAEALATVRSNRFLSLHNACTNVCSVGNSKLDQSVPLKQSKLSSRIVGFCLHICSSLTSMGCGSARNSSSGSQVNVQ